MYGACLSHAWSIPVQGPHLSSLCVPVLVYMLLKWAQLLAFYINIFCSKGLVILPEKQNKNVTFIHRCVPLLSSLSSHTLLAGADPELALAHLCCSCLFAWSPPTKIGDHGWCSSCLSPPELPELTRLGLGHAPDISVPSNTLCCQSVPALVLNKFLTPCLGDCWPPLY